MDASIVLPANFLLTPPLLFFQGACAIIQDVMRDKKKIREHLYNQLMLGMSCFDVIYSIAWMFSTIPIPIYNEFGSENNIYGAVGNEATCTAQGFFLQLGLASIFFNVSLSLYYYLVIVQGWRAQRLKTVRIWLFIGPMLAGFALAFGGIPLYTNVIWACHIPPKPLISEQWPSLLFVVVPVVFALFFATCMIGLVYWKVRQQVRRTVISFW
jgi:hypothetical protein